MLHTDFGYRLPIFQSSITAGATATGNIDTLGFDLCRISVLLPTADVVSNKPSTLKVSESDDTVVTNFTDVVGLRSGTDFTLPNCITAATSITQPYAVLTVNCQARKRYLKVSVAAQVAQVVNVIAELQRPEVSPLTTDQATVVVNL